MRMTKTSCRKGGENVIPQKMPYPKMCGVCNILEFFSIKYEVLGLQLKLTNTIEGGHVDENFLVKRIRLE